MAATKNSTKVVKKKPIVGKKNSPIKSNALKNIFKSVKKAVSIPHSNNNKKLPALDKIDQAFNKSRLIVTLAERVNITKKQASLFIDELCKIIGLHLKKGGPEKFVLPGAFKVVVRKIAAKKARNGINPFTGQPIVFKAKPASRRVKIIPLKSLKDMAI